MQSEQIVQELPLGYLLPVCHLYPCTIFTRIPYLLGTT